MDVIGRNNDTQNFQNIGTGSSRESTFSGDISSKTSNLSEAASDLLKDGKKVANGLYEQGKHRVTEMQESIQVYSNELAKHVHTRPITTILIAAGIGFILARLLRH